MPNSIIVTGKLTKVKYCRLVDGKRIFHRQADSKKGYQPLLVNRRTLRIEWGQCDPVGIVFYPHYFIIFDTSTGWLFGATA
jgi:hypothetical protein